MYYFFSNIFFKKGETIQGGAIFKEGHYSRRGIIQGGILIKDMVLVQKIRLINFISNKLETPRSVLPFQTPHQIMMQ